MLCRVILKNPPNQICYFASWHGPHNEYSKIKRIEVAKELIRYVRSKCQGHPFIIGGDFNLKASDFPARDCDVEVIFDNRNSIDYFVLGDCSTIPDGSPDNRLEHILSSTPSTCSFDETYKNGMVKKTTVDDISYYVIKDSKYTVNEVLKNHPDIKTDSFFLLGKEECAYNRLTTTIQENAVRVSYDEEENAPLDHKPITLSLRPFESKIYTARYSFGEEDQSSYARKLFSRFRNKISITAGSITKYVPTEDNSTNSTPNSIEAPTVNSRDPKNEDVRLLKDYFKTLELDANK